MLIGAVVVSVELADSKEELQTSTPSLVLAPHTFCFRRLSSGCGRQRVLGHRNEVEAGQCCRGQVSTRAVS